MPRAVVRLLALRQPANAAEVLLGYLTSAPNEATAQEVRGALAAVAVRNGQPDKYLVQSLKDKDPARRAAAAAALGREAGNAKERPGQRLFLHGTKRAMTGVFYRDGKKAMEWEIEDVKFFNKLEERVFAKP